MHYVYYPIFLQRRHIYQAQQATITLKLKILFNNIFFYLIFSTTTLLFEKKMIPLYNNGCQIKVALCALAESGESVVCIYASDAIRWYLCAVE